MDSDTDPKSLVGKRVRFLDDEEHAECWHQRVGLKTGVVRKVAQTRAQKASMVGEEGLALPDLEDAEPEAPRVWVLADPNHFFPSGCEAVVSIECLTPASS